MRQLPILTTKLFSFHGRDVRLYKILQHGSTLVGFAILTASYFRWFKQAASHDVDPEYRGKAEKKIGLLFVFWLIAAAPALVFAVKRTKHLTAFSSLLGRFIVAACVLFLLLLLVYSVFWHLRRNDVPRKTE